MDLAQGFNCTFCPSLALDPLGHHPITCKHGGDVVSCHNKLRDVLVECCRYLPRSRLAVALGMTNTTPDQQMFWFPTGPLGNQLHLISLLPHR